MRTPQLFFCTLLSLFANNKALRAQSPNHSANTKVRTARSRSFYTAYTWDVSKPLWVPHSSGMVDVSFPYTVKDVSTGVTEQKVFHVDLKNRYAAKSSLACDLIGIEFGGSKQFLSIRMGLNLNFNATVDPHFVTGFYETVSYGRNFSLANPFKPAYKTQLSNYRQNTAANPDEDQNKLLVSPSLGICLYINTLDIKEKINNQNKEVDLAGMVAWSTFTSTSSGKSNNSSSSTTTTSQASEISLFFSNVGLSLAPQISISTNPISSKNYWKFNFSLLIPVYTEARINFVQKGNNGQHNLGTKEINPSVFNMQYNNATVTKYPFSFSGFMIGITYGLRRQRP